MSKPQEVQQAVGELFYWQVLNILWRNFYDLLEFMYQSIPAVPIPPPGISRAFAHVSIAGVGHLKFCHCPGVRHLPTPGRPRGI